LHSKCPGGEIGRHTSLRGWRRQKRASSSLVLGTILVQIADNEHSLLLANLLLPLLLPTFNEMGIVKNEYPNIILPYKAAKLNDKSNDLKKEWYIEFWAWSFSENKLIRKRLTTINSLKTIEERKIYASNVIKDLNKALEAGYHFDKLKIEKQKAVEHVNKIVNHISITEYLLDAVEQNKNRYNGRSYDDIKSMVKKFNEFIIEAKLNHLGFSDLEKKHCLSYQKSLVTKDYSGKTINCRMSTISTLYNEGIENEIVTKNPFLGIKRMKEVKTGINKALNATEIEKIKVLLIDNHPDVWLACMMMFYCFLRPNEIRQLKLKNILLDNKKIYVGSIVSKNKKSFQLDMPEPLVNLIKNYINDESDKDKYLITGKGVPDFKMCGRNTLRDKYERIIESLKLDSDLTFYSWKHTGVVKAYQSGIDIKSIQLHGRWHSIDMMDKYLKSLGLIENKNFTSVMNKIEL